MAQRDFFFFFKIRFHTSSKNVLQGLLYYYIYFMRGAHWAIFPRPHPDIHLRYQFSRKLHSITSLKSKGFSDHTQGGSGQLTRKNIWHVLLPVDRAKTNWFVDVFRPGLLSNRSLGQIGPCTFELKQLPLLWQNNKICHHGHAVKRKLEMWTNFYCWGH